MLIALDYDGTYTKEPILWKAFINHAVRLGHKVVCITMRRPNEAINDMSCPVIYTSRQAKLPYAKENNIEVDIWIDDKPVWLLEDAPSR